MLVWPPTALHPEVERAPRKLAHSERFALPRMTAPADAEPAHELRVLGRARPEQRPRPGRVAEVRGVDVVLEQHRDALESAARTVGVSVRVAGRRLGGGRGVQLQDRVHVVVERADAAQVGGGEPRARHHAAVEAGLDHRDGQRVEPRIGPDRGRGSGRLGDRGSDGGAPGQGDDRNQRDKDGRHAAHRGLQRGWCPICTLDPIRWLMRGRSPADLTGCGRAAPDPPGPLRLPGGPRTGLEPAPPRVRVRGEQRVVDHAARRAVLRAGHAGRAARARARRSGPKPRPTSARRPSTTRSTGASTTCSSPRCPGLAPARAVDGQGLREGRAPPQPALQPGVRRGVGDDRLLPRPLDRAPLRGPLRRRRTGPRLALPVAPRRGGRAQVRGVRRVEGGRREAPPLRAGRHDVSWCCSPRSRGSARW